MRARRTAPALFVAAALVAGLLLGACGGGGGDGEEAVPTSTVSESTPAEELEFEGDPDSAFCRRSRAAAEEPVENPFAADLDPREVELRFRALESRFREFEGAAPAALQADLDLLVTTFDRFARLLEEVDFDFAELARRDVDRSIFDDPRLAEVAVRLETYQEQVCARS